MKANVHILRCFSDNYIYLLEYAKGLALAVDPGQAQPVLKALAQEKLTLTHVLVTHRHSDHSGGIGDLKKKTGCTVITGAGEQIDQADQHLQDGQMLTLSETRIQCISTPGHTVGSACFYLSGANLKTPVLLTGDTLFVCGCGRMFETDGLTMWTSLQKLATLPDETLVYPGHDYTEENLRFALLQQPGDPLLTAKLEETKSLAAAGRPTVPSTLAFEKICNPFLRAPDADTFTRLRRQKDVF